MSKPSVAVFHPRLGFGGSEAFAMWTLEALKRDYRIALVAGGAIDLGRLNQFYGTALDGAQCETIALDLPRPLATAEWGAALRGRMVERAMRRYLERFDVLISAYNIASFGRPGIHHLADFSWDEGLRRTLDPPPGGMRRMLHVIKPLRRGYLAMARALGKNAAAPASDGPGLVLANSQWSKEVLLRRHGIESEVLYPPAPMRPPTQLHAKRLRRFVSLGRIYPEKRIEVIIDMLKTLRARGHDLTLHVVGDTRETAYGREIERRCRRESWIVLEGRRFGAAKTRLLAESAFGIHARPGEAFGIAVAEMLMAGCLPFVPAEGGPAEIVGHHPALVYAAAEEGIAKIEAMLRDPALERETRAAMLLRARDFTAEAFMGGIKRTVDRFVRTN